MRDPRRELKGQAPQQPRYLPVALSASETAPCPPFGLLRKTGVDSSGNVTVARPNADGMAAGGLLINGPGAIPPGGAGSAHATFSAVVAFDNDGGAAPAFGEAWGAASGSYLLTRGQGSYLIDGGADKTAGLVNVVPAPVGVSVRRSTDGVVSQTVAGVGVVTFGWDSTAGATPWSVVADGVTPGGVVVKIAPSGGSSGSAGVLSNAAQNIAGLKTFVDHVSSVYSSFGGGTADGCYNTFDANTSATNTGKSGTLQVGATVSGGIVTNLGSGGAPGAGTVTSVAAAGPAGLLAWSSAVTSSGTLTASLATQSANQVFAGPAAGAAAAPTFRALVAADLPAVGSTTQVIFNSAGVLAGAATLTFNNSTGKVKSDPGSDHTAFDAASGYVATLGTAGNTFLWGASTPAPTTASGSPTTRYGGNTKYCGDPDAWVLIQIGSATYAVPAYLVAIAGGA